MAMGAPLPAARAKPAAPVAQVPHQAPPQPQQAQQLAAPPQANPPPLGDAIVAPPGQVRGGAGPADGPLQPCGWGGLPSRGMTKLNATHKRYTSILSAAIQKQVRKGGNVRLGVQL